VYAANVNYDTVSSKLQTGVATFTDINTLTVGNVIIHGTGEQYGITIGDDTGHQVIISNHDISATGSVHASIISTGFSRMDGGKLFAKNSLLIGTSDLNNPMYDNSKFAVNGENGSFKAANGKFNVSNNGAITADSLMLADSYNVKKNIEDAKDRITTVESNLNTNKADLTALQGRVNGHDTDINALKTTTQGITRVEGNGTTVEGVNFKDGAVSGVKSINGRIKISTDGKTVTFNEGVGKGQVIISENGIKVGTGSTYVSGDAVYTGGADYDAAKAGMKKDGSLKATGFSVDGATGNTTVGGTLDVTGATTLKDTLNVKGATTLDSTLNVKGATTLDSTLNVAGKTTLKDELQVDKTATFGSAADSQTVINGGEIKADGKLTSKSASIGTVGITDTGVVTGITKLTAKELDVTDSLNIVGDITGSTLKGKSLEITGNGTITGSLDVTGAITGATINGATINTNSFNGAQISNNKFNGVTLETNGDVTGGTITGTTVMDGAGASMNAGTVTGNTITDGQGFTATGGNVIAKNIQADTGTIAGVSFAAGGNVSGITELTATTIKDGAGTIITGGNVESKTAKIGAIKIENETIEGSSANGLSIEGVKIKDGVMSSVVSIDAAKATIGGVNTLDNTGLTVKTGSKVQVGTNTVIEDGSVKVSQKTSLTDQSLQLNDTNKWTQAGGLVADKATVNGIALGTDSKGKATFSDAAGKTTTIDGDTITTGTITADELNVDKISLGKGTDKNITIGSNGDVTTKGDVTVTGADDDTTVIDGAKATFGKNAANQTIIDKGTIKAKAKSMTSQIAEFGFDENGLTVSGQNAEGKTSYFSYNAKTGVNTFTGQDGTTTAINGSAITSTNGSATGVLNGSNLTLTNGTKSTALEAGKATYTGKAGSSSKHGTTTTIDGGVITTDTLNVERIQLGEKIVDQRTGETIGSGVTLAADGGFTAAGGNFKVTGGTTGSRGSITNVVGDATNGKTVFETNQQGANMSFKKGDVKSEVAVADGKAEMAVGANAAVTTTDGKVEIKGGTQTVTTTGDGTVFENSAHKTAFVDNGATNTIINGNEITTGKITTDELVITGKGDAAGTGTGSLAFGGNGTIKSDVKKDGSTNNTQFTTDINGVNTMVTDGTTTTENKVSSSGNSNTVKQDDEHKSEFNQGLTSIGGVVTNGEIKVGQYLDGETGLLTDEVKDANGSSKLVQSGTGLEYTDSAKPDNATRINSSDVSIGSATNEKDRINLSDLGQIDNLDTELTARDEYKNNQTAVGGINAEAAIRREEVARLDGRINDVNDRVNKVGAMAAAIASLKSIGYDPQAPSEFSIGLGQYKGETGVAMGFFHYPDKNFMINVSLSTAGGETMGGIGATWRFGHKSPQKLLEEQREEQAKKELAAAEKYQAAAKLAKEAQERAEYAAKLARQAQVSADNAKAAADATQAKHFG
jgi:archaellum component FlaC